MYAGKEDGTVVGFTLSEIVTSVDTNGSGNVSDKTHVRLAVHEEGIISLKYSVVMTRDRKWRAE